MAKVFIFDINGRISAPKPLPTDGRYICISNMSAITNLCILFFTLPIRPNKSHQFHRCPQNCTHASNIGSKFLPLRPIIFQFI